MRVQLLVEKRNEWKLENILPSVFVETSKYFNPLIRKSIPNLFRNNIESSSIILNISNPELIPNA